MSEDPHRYCVYCMADCSEGDPEHAADCPSTTGLFPVTGADLGIRGPDDPYAHGMTCMDCGAEFKVGDFYAQRQVESHLFEIVCVGCSVLNPSDYQTEEFA